LIQSQAAAFLLSAVTGLDVDVRFLEGLLRGFFLSAIPTSTCRSSITICSGLYFFSRI
jgi:hypothetical protein